MRNKRNIYWSSLMIGVLLIVMAVIVLSRPEANIIAITWIIGLLAIINGLLEIVYRRIIKRIFGIASGWTIALGITHIIFGLILILNTVAGSIFVLTLFAIWFILSAILSFFTMTPLRFGNRGLRIVSVILNIIFLVAGIILLFNPLLNAVVIAFIIAFSLFVSGLYYVIDAFD